MRVRQTSANAMRSMCFIVSSRGAKGFSRGRTQSSPSRGFHASGRAFRFVIVILIVIVIDPSSFLPGQGKPIKITITTYDYEKTRGANTLPKV
jgi:hypothetical protein